MRNLVLAASLATAPALQGSPASAIQESVPAGLPTGPLVFGAFTARFDDGSYSVTAPGWPKIEGGYAISGDELELTMKVPEELAGDPIAAGCDQPGRHAWRVEGTHLEITVIEDACMPRRVVLGQSDWRPAGEDLEIPPRDIVLTQGDLGDLPEPADASGSWPSFRGPGASGVADGMDLPASWNGETGENVLWRTPIPGLAHASPVVWGDRLFVTSAVSGEQGATFRPGLYGDGDASEDRSVHRFEITALDKRTGEVLWTRVAAETAPVDKRHIKATYANATPATDGRIVVASFGSQGVFAYTVEGRFLWKVEMGHLDLGAYDIPSYEWGPASSPFIWKGRVFLQCDTQADSFVLALDLETGETIWKADRDELPTWGTPTVVEAESGPELVTNGSNYIRGLDPMTGEELWRLGRSSKITAPTPVFADGLIVVASGRGPERPIFVVRPGSRGDLTLPQGDTASEAVAWSIERRGPYMPTPVVYGGILYVINNNGEFAGYDVATGKQHFRERTSHRGSGFSASPVAADGKLYLSSEDGDILVFAAGTTFEHLATNPIGELLMATPALSEGVLYVRSASSVLAIGRRSFPGTRHQSDVSGWSHERRLAVGGGVSPGGTGWGTRLETGG